MVAKIIPSGGAAVPAWRQKLEEATATRLKTQGHGPASGVRPNSVMLVVDCSGSMDGDKLRQARKGGLGFAEQAFRDGYGVGLIAFDSDARLLTSPVRDQKEISAAAERLSIGGSTNMAAGIVLATEQIGKEGGTSVICIVTDGYPDDPEAAIRAAHAAKEKQIDIIAIGTDDADQEFLARLATRKELARKVERPQLRKGISEMALLLPKPR